MVTQPILPPDTKDRVKPLPAAWQCDLADDSLRWSDGVYDLFGIPRGTRVDRRETAEMYVAESREMLEQLRSKAITNRESFTFEAKIKRTDGEFRWMRVTADIVCKAGRVRLLYGTKQDITDEMAMLSPGRAQAVRQA